MSDGGGQHAPEAQAEVLDVLQLLVELVMVAFLVIDQHLEDLLGPGVGALAGLQGDQGKMPTHSQLTIFNFLIGPGTQFSLNCVGFIYTLTFWRGIIHK